LDSSFYAVQFDTSRDLVANNNPEGVTGLYAIFNSLINSSDINIEAKNKFDKSSLHDDYPTATLCAYLLFFTTKNNIPYKQHTMSREKGYILLQDFKQRCFQEITHALEELMPKDGIEWRFEKK
jgi:hypothetical protein